MTVAWVNQHTDGHQPAGAASAPWPTIGAVQEQWPSWLTPELAARMTAELAAETAAIEAAGAPVGADDLYPGDPDGASGPRFLGEEDLYDDLPPMSRVDGLEWELWAGAEQDEAEREMLRLKAPAWAFLP
ncbi:hypothetical protein, partial [Kribbella sindirgiensis]